MFYIKTELPDGKTVKTEVTDENVFTRCPGCGDEVSVDLAELFSDSESDLYWHTLYLQFYWTWGWARALLR